MEWIMKKYHIICKLKLKIKRSNVIQWALGSMGGETEGQKSNQEESNLALSPLGCSEMRCFEMRGCSFK
jgi:hypothetical protein